MAFGKEAVIGVCGDSIKQICGWGWKNILLLKMKEMVDKSEKANRKKLQLQTWVLLEKKVNGFLFRLSL